MTGRVEASSPAINNVELCNRLRIARSVDYFDRVN